MNTNNKDKNTKTNFNENNAVLFPLQQSDSVIQLFERKYIYIILVNNSNKKGK